MLFRSSDITPAQARMLSVWSTRVCMAVRVFSRARRLSWALPSFSMMPWDTSSASRPRALHTELTVVTASVTVSTTVALISSCTAVLALLVILGAMAFFFWFS